jgi:hypothetical protein
MTLSALPTSAIQAAKPAAALWCEGSTMIAEPHCHRAREAHPRFVRVPDSLKKRRFK